jgi:hypothetical protein
VARRITVDELFTLLRFAGNEFFSVEFKRRTDSVKGVPAGTTRKMLCRTGMQAYKQGIQSDSDRDARDYQHGILTVWSLDAYNEYRKRGIEKDKAARRAWRTIDLVTVTSCSLLTQADLPEGVTPDLPPDIRANQHQITNKYRLAHMPRKPI